MSIRIGIYDFFAYTIPGTLYLIATVYICHTAGLCTVDRQWLHSISTVEAILFALVGYVVGLLLDPLAKRWYGLFKPKNLSKAMLDEFVRKHPTFAIKFGGDDWYIVLSHLRRVSDETAYNIERLNATNILLRNVSFLSLILILTQVWRMIIQFSWIELILGIVFAISTLISAKEGVKYTKWFYSSQYESLAAYSVTAIDLIERRAGSERIDQPMQSPSPPSAG